MSRLSRLFTIATASIAVLAATMIPVAFAEVSAEVNADGKYLRTIVLSNSSVKHTKIWTVNRARKGFVVLNADGDLNGDLFPVIVENPARGVYPWVVWSRFNGTDYDLAWSHWEDATEWSAIRWLEPNSRMGDDLDPDSVLSETGRPYTTWWNDDDGVGKVYFSMYLSTAWMAGYLVSDPDVDSRHPSISVNTDGSVEIEFMTAAGIEKSTIVFHKGVSINDDFDPYGSMTVSHTDEATSLEP